jgi:type IV secretion system protein VirB3
MTDGDTLFVATTRPAMKMGVPVEGLFVNAAVTYLAYLWIGHGNIYRMLPCLLIFPIVHIPMRILASIDHNMFRIGRLWLERGICFRTRAWRGELLPALPHRAPASAREMAGSF